MRLIGRSKWGGSASEQLTRALDEIHHAFIRTNFKTAAGRYAATLCVTSAAQVPNCGPAELSVRGPDVVLQVADIAWRLHLNGRQAVVVMTQGSVQIDQFDTGAEWSGASLRFHDDDKRVRYEVQIGARRAH